MNEYYFLFGVALVWICAAVIQDIKKREVPNWLNFSLVGFALGYRALYAVFYNDWKFFAFGAIGLIIFIGLGNIFYYGRVFAGGDAKLLIALGTVMPFEKAEDLFVLSIIFVVLLFCSGAVYSLIYSGFIVAGRKKKFAFEFGKYFRRHGKWFGVYAAILLLAFGFFNDILLGLLFYALFFFMGLLFFYLRALDRCMIKLVEPKNLTEGDWLELDVRVGGKWIRKSVHGLSLKEIKLLRNARKSVYIKEGIPFTPAFLFAFVLMVFFYLTGEFYWARLVFG